MVGLLDWALALCIAVILILLVVFLALASYRNRRTGATGIVQRSRLTCPKCHETFDYEWFPGASLTSVRLGKDRYMACPRCGRWSMFDVWDAAPPGLRPGA